MELLNEPASVSVLVGPLVVAEARRCTIVPDHWWLVSLETSGDLALPTVKKLVSRLQARHASQVNVDTGEVRPDLGRTFFMEAGFARAPSDLSDTAPLELSLIS